MARRRLSFDDRDARFVAAMAHHGVSKIEIARVIGLRPFARTSASLSLAQQASLRNAQPDVPKRATHRFKRGHRGLKEASTPKPVLAGFSLLCLDLNFPVPGI
jgi:hypothetical protein